jgi:3D (Asp-Asp-Asp) domain-containing protein
LLFPCGHATLTLQLNRKPVVALKGAFLLENMKKHISFLILTAIAWASCAIPLRTTRADTSPNTLTLSEDANQVMHMRITAYSSSPDETDDTPFTTAMGTEVRDGVVATNILPFGTKIQIPALFGNKIFTVEDRMNHRIKNAMDIWMPNKAKALRFGANYADVVIIGKNADALSQIFQEKTLEGAQKTLAEK